MTIKAGDTLPDAQFMTMTADGPRPIKSDEKIRGRGDQHCVSLGFNF